MKTILATAYAINPYKGSEDGMGWNFMLQIARFQKVIAVTRENNQNQIEKYQAQFPNELYKNIQFIYFDLPYWMRFWKKGSRGAMLYYLMWQYGIVSFIRKKKLVFDIAHNVNFHNDWTPSFLHKLNKPLVWGPIGHHPAIPKQYLKLYPYVYLIKDQLTWLIKKCFWRFSTALKTTVTKSNYVLTMNSAVVEHLPELANKSAVMPSVATQDYGFLEDKKEENNTFTLISAGRFVPLKGFDLSIISFSKFLKNLTFLNLDTTNIELVLVGNGPEELFLKSLVKELKIEKNVQFVHWIERTELMEKFKNASVFLFPSHEGAGMVVAEALSFALPVICLENTGPGEFVNELCGIKIKHQKHESTTDALSIAINKLYTEPKLRAQMGLEARKHFLTHFHWDRRGEALKEIYDSL